jgi:hypothetical protein
MVSRIWPILLSSMLAVTPMFVGVSMECHCASEYAIDQVDSSQLDGCCDTLAEPSGTDDQIERTSDEGKCDTQGCLLLCCVVACTHFVPQGELQIGVSDSVTAAFLPRSVAGATPHLLRLEHPPRDVIAA